MEIVGHHILHPSNIIMAFKARENGEVVNLAHTCKVIDSSASPE